MSAKVKEEREIVLPFLKWAGGKRWLTAAYPELLDISFNRYIEPFLGSGAVFFHLAPVKSVLSDQNGDLINTYKAIKSDWRSVADELSRHQSNHSKQYYYDIRDSRPRAAHTKAARFIYLNRTCWNGLYRVNLRGEFNVPIGTKQSVILDTDDFGAVARLLKNADLRSGDFEETMELAGKDDLLFIDPPYTVKHNLNGFVKYNENIFCWDDQIRLRNAVKRAKHRGARIVLTNAHHHSLIKLYKDLGELRKVTRSSILAADAARRGECDELVVLI